MLEDVVQARSTALTSEQYLSDFWPYFQKLQDVFWKLETYQNFREPDDASWRALDAGNWNEAVRLIDERRDEIQEPVRQSRDFSMRRVRIVEKPFTPYVQWELYYIRLRAQAGEDIRVLESDVLPKSGFSYRLPELVILDSAVMYEVLYSADGTLAGARKIVDRGLIDSCRRDVERLFDMGRDLLPYLHEERAALPPPLQQSDSPVT
ncbi:DUF6879 family protein [Microbispora sp. NBC_01389]|uniref:DUF6879 family protein n=1 Tax=Microbispora sp. NBC_01389 TaxID=2903584 RepID=UPI0032513CBA